MTPAKELLMVIGCINLAPWIPRALVEHKITVSNLKRLIFGKGDKGTVNLTFGRVSKDEKPRFHLPCASKS